MFERRWLPLILSAVLSGTVAACAGPAENTLGAHASVPDTVELPGATPGLDAMAGPAVPARVLTPLGAQRPQSAEGSIDLVLDRPAVADVPAGRLDDNPWHATFAFTGDTLIHSPLVRAAAQNAGGNGYDFAPMFARVAPILSAVDFAVCHLETPVAPPGEGYTTFPKYGIPAEIAPGLRAAGYDRCSTASNHVMDRGTAAIDATVDALLSAGLSQDGMARTPEESVTTLVDVHGVTVAHLSYTFGLNGLQLPRDEPWRTHLIDIPAIVAAGADARARGAEIVIVNMHWGDEGSSRVSADQRRWAAAIAASHQFDLIVGEHSHMVQPIEQVDGTWVVYGLGNFLSAMPTGPFPPPTQDGMIVSVAIDERADGTFAVSPPVVIPTWVDRDNGYVVRPVVADLSDPSIDQHTKDQMSTSLQRTSAIVGEFITG